MDRIRNVVFDLAGVVFARSRTETPERLLRYFSFINSGEPMPRFWQDYDRGIRTIDEVASALASYRDSTFEEARSNMLEAVLFQREVEPTANLISDLSDAGMHLYVLSNMSREYISFLRSQKVYSMFEGDVVSCDVGFCKPEREIYAALLDRFSLEAGETLFIDDRLENIVAAESIGIHGFHFDRERPEESCAAIRAMLLGKYSE